MSDIVMTPVRMERWLHTAAGEAAATRQLSLNKFMVAAIARAVSDVAAAEENSTGGQATFELTVRFNVHSGAKADDQAYDVMDQVAGAARIAGASVLSTDLTRLTAMKPRSI
jgi:HicB family